MDTIFYTHALDTHSSAVRTLYFDEDTGNVWLVFPNGTVVNRYQSNLTLPALDDLLADNDDSLGKLWNNVLKHWTNHYNTTTEASVQFVKREDTEVADSATEQVAVEAPEAYAAKSPFSNVNVTLTISGMGLFDLEHVSAVLKAAGIEHTVRSAEAW